MLTTHSSSPAVSRGNINFAIIIDVSNLNGTATVSNNFVDLSGDKAANFLFAGHYNGKGAGNGRHEGKVKTLDNINMVTGGNLSPQCEDA